MNKAIASLIILLFCAHVQADEAATHLVEKSETHTRGKSFKGKAVMTVHKGDDTRRLSMNIWTSGQDKALIKITEPAKDKGVGNLRLGLEFWQYLPNANRIIKIPPSMMLQSWMGSDFTNDDLVKSSSLVRDYTHKILSNEKLGKTDTVKILCTPKPDAPVVWGKVELWVRKGDAVPVQQYFYSESGELIKKMVGDNIKKFGTHIIPTKLTMMDVKNGTNKTVVEYDSKTIKFDSNIPSHLFTQNTLKKQD